MEFNELMQAFAAEAGIPGFVPDGSGVYSLAIDGMQVDFAADLDRGQLVFVGEVGVLPQFGRAEFLQLLMEAMFFGRTTAGAVFALKPGSDRLKFRLAEPLELMTAPRFHEVLELFVNTLEQWRRVCADCQSIGEKVGMANGGRVTFSQDEGIQIKGLKG